MENIIHSIQELGSSTNDEIDRTNQQKPSTIGTSFKLVEYIFILTFEFYFCYGGKSSANENILAQTSTNVAQANGIFKFLIFLI